MYSHFIIIALHTRVLFQIANLIGWTSLDIAMRCAHSWHIVIPKTHC